MTYYIQHNDVYYKLDATEDITTTFTGRTTQHPTGDRNSRSDNYLLDNATSTFSGVVTDIQTPTSNNKLGAGGYITQLKAAMDSREPLWYKYRLDEDAEFNWFITSLEVNQTNRHGFGGVDLEGNINQSFEINVTLERITTSYSIDVTLEVDSKYSDSLQEKGTSSGTTKTPDETEPEEKLNDRTAILVEYFKTDAKFKLNNEGFE